MVFPPKYDVNTWCEFHFGAPDHAIENCKGLKYKVQDLINSKEITFAPNSPNVNNNPMPPHNKTVVSMIEVEENKRLMSQVDKLKTHLIDIKNVLMKNDPFPICSANCKHCLIDPQQCEFLKNVIQGLMDQRILVVERLSSNEDVSTLEFPYDEVQPLLIPCVSYPNF